VLRWGAAHQVIDAQRARANNTLVVDVGNIISASLYYYFYGAPLIASTYAKLGYDAVLWQAQDFVLRYDDVVAFIKIAQAEQPAMQFVASNLQGYNEDTRANGTVIARYAIKQFSGNEQVGYAGTLTRNLASQINSLGRVNTTDEAAALLVAVAALANRGVNKIVAAVSSNATAELVLSSVPGIDVLIVPNQLQANERSDDLRSGAVGPYPMVYQAAWEQPVLVVSSGTFGRLVGVLDLEFDVNGVLTSWGGDTLAMDDTVAPDAGMQAELLAQFGTVQIQFSATVGW
jgi:5'-nucleotidase